MLCIRFLIVPIFPLTVEARALDTIPPLLNIANEFLPINCARASYLLPENVIC
jgi:hypothetical protein